MEPPPVGVLHNGGRREKISVYLGEHFVALALGLYKCKCQFIHEHRLIPSYPRTPVWYASRKAPHAL